MNEVKTKSQTANSQLFNQLFLVIVAIAAGFFGGWYGGQQQDRQAVSNGTITRQIVEGEEDLINTIAKDLNPSVVSINVTSTAPNNSFFGFGEALESDSAGTGFIIRDDGYVVTNRHVVASADSKVSVVLSDGTEITDVEVVGRTNASDPLDVAFLKIKDAGKYNLKAVNLADSDKVEVGDRVVAIGNALGQFQNTVTSGIISGFGRDIEAFDGNGTERLQNLFQTDAAINSGNSGGPLVNSASEVIGINVATASAENISFAIPINDVKGLIDTVLERGKLERPYLGVRYVPLNAEVAEQIGIETQDGAYIPRSTRNRPSIQAGSPAEKAGLQEEDIIVEINGKRLDEKHGLVSVLGTHRVGDTVTLKVVRGSETKDLTVTLTAAPEQ